MYLPEAVRVSKRMQFEALQTFRDGLFEVQDEGSQILSYLVGPQPGETVVDACAGAGGKSLHLAQLMKDDGRIYATDAVRERLSATTQRAKRAGIKILRAMHSDELPACLSPEGADRVLVDAPCSGTGVFRRNPWAKLFLTADDVRNHARQQKAILRTNAMFVRPGGRLVYATCSLLEEENEGIVHDFLGSHPDFELLPVSELLGEQGLQAISSGTFLVLYPYRHQTDGFFGAVMVRR